MKSFFDHNVWRGRFARSGYFLGALLLHLILFLTVATYIVFKTPAKKATSSFLPVSIQPPAVPAPPPPSDGEVANNFEPAVPMAPPPSVPSMVATVSPSSFAVKAVSASIPNLPASPSLPVGTGISGHDAPGEKAGAGNPFGRSDGSGTGQLRGYLYDLKQTSNRKSTNMNPGNYHRQITEFIKRNWDPGFLAQYYKCPKPLNTSFIFIPTIDAEDGPKAFGVEKDIRPNMYAIWYKATATPTQNGTYHFVGIADDILVVRVNGSTVLDGCLSSVDDDVRKKETTYATVKFHPSCPADGILYVGIPFRASAGKPVNLDVLIGEEPGVYSNYFLYLQREESTYQTQSNSTPLLPVFQLDSNPIHAEGKPLSYPPYSSTPEPWGAGSK